MSSNKKNYTRMENIYLAKLNERAERYEDMINSIKNIIEIDPHLTSEEREIFSSGYKNLTLPKRSSWRILTQMEKKEIRKMEYNKDKQKSNNLEYIRLTKENIYKEIKQICQDIQDVVDNDLLPNCPEDDFDSKVFYLKLKGDYFRYFAEVTCPQGNSNSNTALENEYLEAIQNVENCYKIAYNISEKELPIFSTIRLGLCLNYSVFYYEVLKNHEEGTYIARQGFEEAVKLIDDLDKNKVKDAISIIQILKENLILWTSEMHDDEIEVQ